MHTLWKVGGLGVHKFAPSAPYSSDDISPIYTLLILLCFCSWGIYPALIIIFLTFCKLETSQGSVCFSNFREAACSAHCLFSLGKAEFIYSYTRLIAIKYLIYRNITCTVTFLNRYIFNNILFILIPSFPCSMHATVFIQISPFLERWSSSFDSRQFKEY